jgi:hypothetical protein
MGIMLILTLTISAFSAKDDPSKAINMAGDYSAVFPLLVVSVYVAMMLSRDFVFYSSQRSRGDIIAVPEVLCQPGMAGEPVVVRYDESESDNSSIDSSTSSLFSDVEKMHSSRSTVMPVSIENVQLEMLDHEGVPMIRSSSSQASHKSVGGSIPVSHMWSIGSASNEKQLSSARLDELLNIPLADEKKEDIFESRNHRRWHSLPVGPQPNENAHVNDADRPKRPSPVSTKHVRSNTKGSLVRISSFGKLEDHQPALLDQARLRAASSAADAKHHRLPSSSGGSTKKGQRRIPSNSPRSNRDKIKHASRLPSSFVESATLVDTPLALSLDDIEQSFDQVLNLSSQVQRPNHSL